MTVLIRLVRVLLLASAVLGLGGGLVLLLAGDWETGGPSVLSAFVLLLVLWWLPRRAAARSL
ncbi:MAG: hypothetical protein PGN07_10720 [Aeromicrobium erythreum]